MTQTATARTDTETPAWEHTLNHWGFLPDIDDTYSGDADYLRARLQNILDDAENQAADYRAAADQRTRDAADFVAQRFLTRGIGRLATELRTYTRAGEEMLALLQRCYPDMAWERGAGEFKAHVHVHALTPDPAQTCARRLRLPEIAPSGSGARRWRGDHEGFPITVHQRDPRVVDEPELTPEVVDWILACGPSLPRISWSRWGYHEGQKAALRGWISDCMFADPGAVAREWAGALGTAELVDCEDGTHEYWTDTDIGLVGWSWVTDQERWNATTAATTAALRAHCRQPDTEAAP